MRSEKACHLAAADGSTIEVVMIVRYRVSKLLELQGHSRLSLPYSLLFKLSFLGVHLRDTSEFLRKQQTQLVLQNGPGV